MDVALTTTSIIMFFVATPEPLSISEIAFMPAGVAAPPSPSMFDARFTVIYFLVSSDSPLKRAFVKGRHSLVIFALRPARSIISRTLIHTA